MKRLVCLLLWLSFCTALQAASLNSLPSGFTAKAVLTSDQVKLQYYESGKSSAAVTGAAPTIIFIPGWTMPGAIWFDEAARMAKEYRVLVLDPRGQGKSQVPDSGYNYARRATDIADLIAHCQCQNIVLVGWSLGGLETLQYVADFKAAKLVGIALVDHSVGTGTPPKAMDPTLFQKIRSDQRAAMAGFARSMFKVKPPKAWFDELVDASLTMSGTNSIALLSQPTPREFWRDAFLKAPVPILYTVIPRFAEQAQIMKAARPDIRVEVFENAGHALFIDDAQGFHRALSDFARAIRDSISLPNQDKQGPVTSK